MRRGPESSGGSRPSRHSGWGSTVVEARELQAVITSGDDRSTLVFDLDTLQVMKPKVATTIKWRSSTQQSDDARSACCWAWRQQVPYSAACASHEAS